MLQEAVSVSTDRGETYHAGCEQDLVFSRVLSLYRHLDDTGALAMKAAFEGGRQRPRRKKNHSKRTMGIGIPMSHNKLPVSMSPSR